MGIALLFSRVIFASCNHNCIVYMFFLCEPEPSVRLLARVRCEEGIDYTTCPVCSQQINGSLEELNQHVDYCLSMVCNAVLRATEPHLPYRITHCYLHCCCSLS